MIFKICKACGKNKPIEEFTRSGSRSNFRKTGDGFHSYCKICNAERALIWRTKNPDYASRTKKINQIPKEDRLLMSAIRHRLSCARTRCKKFAKEIPTVTEMELYELFISQDRKCALTGVLLNLEKEHSLCLSLDKKDPMKGYTKENVQWLAWCVNRAKGDLHQDDFIEMCQAVLNKSEGAETIEKQRKLNLVE